MANSPFATLFSSGNPAQRALDISLPALQQQLSGTPGQDVLGPLQASAQQFLNDNLARSNAAAPNRFSSGLDTQNTLLKERSATDFNTLAANILEQGRQRQLQAAQVLGGLGGQASGQQMDLLRLLMGGLGGGGYQPSGLQQGLQAGGGLAELLMLMGRGGGGGGGFFGGFSPVNFTPPVLFGRGIPFSPSGG